jgi:hypothetical protein
MGWREYIRKSCEPIYARMHVRSSSVAQSSPSDPRFDPFGDLSVQYTAAGTQHRCHGGHHTPPCKVKSVVYRDHFWHWWL